MLQADIDALTIQVLRLLTENKLLRAASEEQRKLNGKMRVTINEQADTIKHLQKLKQGWNLGVYI